MGAQRGARRSAPLVRCDATVRSAPLLSLQANLCNGQSLACECALCFHTHGEGGDDLPGSTRALPAVNSKRDPTVHLLLHACDSQQQSLTCMHSNNSEFGSHTAAFDRPHPAIISD
jgi:hypothetical protein